MENYDSDVRPTDDVANPVVVNMDITLHQIVGVDARDQIMTCSVWQRLYWIDDHLQWDPANYSGLRKIRLSPERVWRPDIALVNDVRGEESDSAEDFPVSITYRGEVAWLTPRLLKSSCIMDMTYFPWDTQVCILQFSSWTHDSSELLLYNMSETADSSSYIENGEFALVGLPVKTFHQYTPCCVHPFTNLQFELHIRRRALYYVSNLVFPSLLITCAGMLVFWLPTDSGEKVSLSVTILLATTVYQLLLADRLPVQSVTRPVISNFLMCTQMLLGMSTALTVFVISVCHQGAVGTKVPIIVRRVISMLSYLVLLRQKAKEILGKNNTPENQKKTSSNHHNGDSGHEAIKLVNPSSANSQDFEAGNTHNNTGPREPDNILSDKGSLCAYIKKISQTLEGFGTILNDRELDEKIKLEWLFVAKVLDRVFLVMFAISLLVCSLVLLTGHQTTHDYIGPIQNMTITD